MPGYLTLIQGTRNPSLTLTCPTVTPAPRRRQRAARDRPYPSALGGPGCAGAAGGGAGQGADAQAARDSAEAIKAILCIAVVDHQAALENANKRSEELAAQLAAEREARAAAQAEVAALKAAAVRPRIPAPASLACTSLGLLECFAWHSSACSPCACCSVCCSD